MKEIAYHNIDEIFSVAGDVLYGIRHLPSYWKEKGIAIPSEYDASRNGGYLALYQRENLNPNGSSELIRLQRMGSINDIEDKEFGCTSKKYRKYAEEKCKFLIQNPLALTSDETSFGIKGGVAISDELVIGFSGRSQFEDELLVIATAAFCAPFLSAWDWAGKDNRLEKLLERQNNPFLCEEILKIVGWRYCH